MLYIAKSGFGALRSWLKFELRDWLYDTLSPYRVQRRGLFDTNVKPFDNTNLDGAVDATYTFFYGLY